MTIHVLHPGLLATIQDLGRFGYQKFGVIVSGAMDAYSLRMANLLVGNEENEGALEITLFGTTLQFDHDTLIAITGAHLEVTIDGKTAPMWRPLIVHKGAVLQFKSGEKGCRAYVAFAGGLKIPEIMGSKSTYIRAGLGGFHGRGLQKGDILHCGPLNKRNQWIFDRLHKKKKHVSWAVNHAALFSMDQTQTIRVLPGAEFDRFNTDSKENLFGKPYTLTTEADRMGYRLEGPSLSLSEPFELLSEGVTFGTIQVPANGKPIILMADRQTTGGYPKIAQVISADLSNLAQLQPMATITFKEVSIEEAEQALIEKERIIEEIKWAIALKTGI